MPAIHSDSSRAYWRVVMHRSRRRRPLNGKPPGVFPVARFERALADRAINVSTSSRFSNLLDMAARGLDKVVRASVHHYNTEAEIDRLVAAVGEIIQAGPRG